MVDINIHKKTLSKPLSVNLKGFFVTGVLCLVFVGNIRAQFLDSLVASFKHSPRIDIRQDSRNSFLIKNFVSISGIKVGLNFNRRVKFGIGYDWVAPSIFKWHSPTQQALVLKMRYYSPYFEYQYYKSKHWEYSIPLQLGTGLFFYKNYLKDGTPYKTQKYYFLTYEPHLIVTYKFLKYFGLGFGLGYRLVLIGPGLGKEMNSPMYVIKTKIYFEDIYRDLKLPVFWKGNSTSNNK